MSLINNKYFGRLHNCSDIWCRWTQWLDVWWLESVRSVKANVLNVEANRSNRKKIFPNCLKGDDRGCKSVLRYGLIWQVALKIHNAFFHNSIFRTVFTVGRRWWFDSLRLCSHRKWIYFSRVFISRKFGVSFFLLLFYFSIYLCLISRFTVPIFASFHRKCCHKVRKFPHKITS